jgi:hypothetical protein
MGVRVHMDMDMYACACLCLRACVCVCGEGRAAESVCSKGNVRDGAPGMVPPPPHTHPEIYFAYACKCAVARRGAGQRRPGSKLSIYAHLPIGTILGQLEIVLVVDGSVGVYDDDLQLPRRERGWVPHASMRQGPAARKARPQEQRYKSGGQLGATLTETDQNTRQFAPVAWGAPHTLSTLIVVLLFSCRYSRTSSEAPQLIITTVCRSCTMPCHDR